MHIRLHIVPAIRFSYLDIFQMIVARCCEVVPSGYIAAAWTKEADPENKSDFMIFLGCKTP